MRKRKFKKSDDGVVGVVVAVLLIGLLVSIVSILQMVYVPKWMEEREAEHMDEVANQFSQLKFAIDTQSANAQTDKPIATSITLGSRELPYLMSVRSFGHLEILSDTCVIEIDTPLDTYTYELGIIKYSSANAYFIDEKFIYECGAIMVSQAQGNSMSIKPSFSVSFDTEDPIDPNLVILTFNLVDIISKGDKVSWSGYDTIPIQTDYSKFTPYSHPNIKTITITTEYYNSWEIFFRSQFTSIGLIENDNDVWDLNEDFKLSPSITGDELILEFNPSYPPDYEKVYDLDLTVIEINAQIGPGWVG
jgi:hypothetical protein